MQLDLFEGPVTENQLMWKDLAEVKRQCDGLRRSLFRRLDTINKIIVELEDDVARLKGGEIEIFRDYTH